MPMRADPTPTCPYCTRPAQFLPSSASLYRGVDYGPVWACLPCDAWVGCHRNSKRHAPLGRLANRELRIAKMEAHAAFDPLWRAKVDRDGCSKQAARGAAYRWLAEQLQIDRAACHIGMFDEELCWAVVDVCRPVGRRVAA